MYRIFALALSLTLAAPVAADEAAVAPVDTWLANPETVLPSDGIAIDDFKWRARPIVVFADSPFDPAFQEQMALIEADFDQLALRDAVVIVDTDPAARSDLRRALRPRGFVLLLLDKEGRVNLRKPFPWDVREMTHAIDKWPTRQRELREERAAGG